MVDKLKKVVGEMQAKFDAEQKKGDARAERTDALVNALKGELQELRSRIANDASKETAGPSEASSSTLDASLLKQDIDIIKQNLDGLKVTVEPLQNIGSWEICWSQVQDLLPAVQSLKQDLGAFEKQSGQDRKVINELKSQAQPVSSNEAAMIQDIETLKRDVLSSCNAASRPSVEDTGGAGGSVGSTAPSPARKELYDMHLLVEHAVTKQGDMLCVIDALQKEVKKKEEKRRSAQDKIDAITTKEELNEFLDTMKQEVQSELRQELKNHSSMIHQAVVVPQTAFQTELVQLTELWTTFGGNIQDLQKNVKILHEKKGSAAQVGTTGGSVTVSVREELKQATSLFLTNKRVVDDAVEEIKRFQRELAARRDTAALHSNEAAHSGPFWTCMGFLGHGSAFGQRSSLPK